MPRNRKPPGRRGTPNNTSGSKKQPVASSSSSTPFQNALKSKQGSHNAYTLQEEAQNTARHQNYWDTDQGLRHTKVNFISAGALDATEPDKHDALDQQHPKHALASMSLDSPEEEMIVEVYEDVADESESQVPETLPIRSSSFFFDSHGSAPVDTGFPAPRARASSPARSTSSEEIILFAGRDLQGRGISRASIAATLPTVPIDAKIRVIEDQIHKREELLEDVLNHGPQSIGGASRTSDSYENLLTRFDAASTKKEHKVPVVDNDRRREEQLEEDALIADYIANIENEEDSQAQESFSHRELGGEIWQEMRESSSEANPRTFQQSHEAWEQDEILDFDDLSTSDGVMGEVKEVLSKRTRGSGIQYLVVWEDQPTDEARWVPITTLSGTDALLHIERFEAEEQLVAEFLGDSGDDSDKSGDVAEETDEEEDGLPHKINRMSDEQIARLLAKQEQLGMGSDELLLFDDNITGDDEGIDGFHASAFPTVKQPTKGKGKSRSSMPSGFFPAARKLADAYDGFDVMDFERPSLKKKPKGRKAKLEFDITDSELEESMATAWANDRSKKKERKQEREELRAQGLLGSKNGKPDLKQKYKEGMGIATVRDEIKQFLMGDNTTLSLPPMDKADRKIVHELANAFKLKSKSDGSGKTRFPILYKTQRTRPYFEWTFDAVEARISRRYLPRMDLTGKRPSNARNTAGRGGGFNKAAVSYRDGDVVGGSAPELGAENRGRAMLEKMGWSTGTALGALNNKGILQPVSHVVKTTKAGLG